MGILLSLLGLNAPKELIKYGLMLLVVLALLFGVYMWGNGNGKASGYKEGWDAQQETVDKLAKTINDSRTATATKVATIERLATDATVTAVKTLAANSSKRSAIVRAFQKTETPACGLTKPAVESINALLDTQVTPSVGTEPPPDDAQPNQPKTETLDEIL